jgi:SRSO17 transposase
VTRAGSRFRRAEPRRRARALAQRQDTGTAGRIENAQVAVYLGYSAPAGHTLIDRELYLPKSRAGDPERCAAAGIPENTAFATKPQLARRLIERAAAADVAFGWVAGDEVYGDNGPLRLAGGTGHRPRPRSRLPPPGARGRWPRAAGR